MGFSKKATKSTFRKKPQASSKPSLASLTKQVKQLQLKTKQVTERDQYLYNDNIDVIGPYTAINLCNYSNWTKMWATTTTNVSNVRSSMYHRYIKIDSLVTLDNINNEEGSITFCYMVVSRRDEAGTATDTSNALALVDGTDFSNYDGISYMNLKKWKVHFSKRFTLTGGDGADMQADQCQKRIVATVKPKCKVVNADGSWRSLANSPDPSDTFYAILFSNNSTLDLENPRWSMSTLHSIDN